MSNLSFFTYSEKNTHRASARLHARERQKYDPAEGP